MPFSQLPFFQLFLDGTQSSVKEIYQRVADIKSSPQIVSFYCDENHVEWGDDLRSWTDTDYFYNAGEDSMDLTFNMHSGDSSTKPRAQKGGSSYATLGMWNQ
jgi:hypothetical protein